MKDCQFNRSLRHYWPLSLVFALSSTFASAEDQGIQDLLKRFDRDPVAVMNEPLLRWEGGGNRIASGELEYQRFSQRAIETGEALRARDLERSKRCMTWQGRALCLGSRMGLHASIEGSDLPEALIDGGAIEMTHSLEALEKAGLKSATLSTQPWSDDYWGHFKGSLGARYADPAFPGDLDWKRNQLYVKNRPASVVAGSGSASQVDVLSPSEKYELLIGDSSASITELMWRRGERHYEETGTVETWLGLCHGWAAAAMSLPRPAKRVVLPSADGRRDLQFYPSDAKALASLLWSEGEYETRFVGGRCNDRNPTLDANGRATSSQCFDSNPGTWHLAVTHQIGVSRRSLVFDASWDYRVWNQPVLGYRYSYFNPQRLTAAATLQEAYVPMQNYSRDKFKKYRSSQAAGAVGIVMELSYVASTRPTHAITDSPAQDRQVTVQYLYDLELDRSGNIIGGEWYTNKHPDFLWVPVPGARAVTSYEDDATGSWTVASPLPPTWRNAAQNAARSGQPLAKIVEAIFSLSSSR